MRGPHFTDGFIAGLASCLVFVLIMIGGEKIGWWAL